MTKQNPVDTLASEYEAWFVENKVLFQSELLALKRMVPADKKGIEIGIGSGIFCLRLNRFWKEFYKIKKNAEKQADYYNSFEADSWHGPSKIILQILIKTAPFISSHQFIHLLQYFFMNFKIALAKKTPRRPG